MHIPKLSRTTFLRMAALTDENLHTLLTTNGGFSVLELGETKELATNFYTLAAFPVFTDRVLCP